MGIFSKREIGKESVLVFDVGSSSVGGAVFEMEKFGVPKIILSVREPITLEEKIDTDHFLSLTLKSLSIVASKICMGGIGRPSKIFCVLSSPWYASQTRIIKLEKNVPFLFTTKLADSLIQKEVSIFEEEYLTKFSNVGSKVRLVEFKNIKTMLNGYVTPEPFNKKTKKIEMAIFVSMSGDEILKKIEETINRHFHSEDIKFSSFAMASFVVARDMFIHQEDFILADIAGEVTDISVAREDILSNSISYPIGSNFIIRKVADNVGLTLDEAKSLVSLYRDKHAIESVEKKLEPLMDKLKTEWLNKFQESLSNLSSGISVPSTIFITIDQELADFFGDIIKSEQFGQYSLTDSKFKIVFLNTQTLHGIATFKDNVIRDPFLTIESAYINRFIF